jgi:hypothetical protein
VDDYEPSSPQLQRVRSRISAASWRRRVDAARADEVVIQQVLAEVAAGVTLNAAMAHLLPANRRSWALRRIPRYRVIGFEALTGTSA